MSDQRLILDDIIFNDAPKPNRDPEAFAKREAAREAKRQELRALARTLG